MAAPVCGLRRSQAPASLAPRGPVLSAPTGPVFSICSPKAAPEHRSRGQAAARHAGDSGPTRQGLARDILKAEQEGDRITHDIIRRLNHDLRNAHRPRGHLRPRHPARRHRRPHRGGRRLHGPLPRSRRRWTRRSRSPRSWPSRCEQLYGLLQNLRGFKDLDHYWIEIHRLENDGDRIYRDAVASLFSNGIDPMVVIRWRDVFLRLERAIDSTETSASIIEGIVMKNA